MASCMSRENWLKGVLGLRRTKDAIIPFLEEHYKQTYEDWNNGDSHLHHLLDLAAKGYLKQKRGEWEVNCSDCEPILKKLMTSHLVPKHLMWNNNTDDQDLSVPNEYRLPKVYMASGNADSSNFNDRDALAILQICKNDKRLDISNEAFVLILFRNRLMHSSDNCIAEEEMTGAFDQMKKLLRNDKLRDREECITALKELDELLQKPMMCEIDESNEIWKMAILIKDMPLQKEGKVNPEALKVLLERTENQLQREQQQRQIAESTLETWQRKLNDVTLKLQKSENNVQVEKIRADCTRDELELERNQRANMTSDYEARERRLLEENRKLKEEVEEMERCNPSLAGRIAKGSATGTVVGIAGGPVGLAVGGAAGGVVGGISYFWDKITGN